MYYSFISTILCTNQYKPTFFPGPTAFFSAQVSAYAKVFSGCCFRMSSCDGDHKGHRNGMFSGNFHRKSWDMMCILGFNLLNNRNSSNRNFTWN